MSTLTTTTTKPAATRPIPDSIRQRLKKLRGQITRFVVVEGLGRVLAVIVLLVLLDLGIDRWFRMDVAQRAIMLVVMAAIIVGVVYWRLVRPLLKRVGDDALVLQIEDRNRQLRESLISTVQFSRERDRLANQGYSTAMVDATIRQGTGLAETIDFGKSINTPAFVRNMLILAAGLAGTLAIAWGVSANDTWRTWFNRNVLLGNDEWPRSTLLVIAGAEDGRLMLLRGEDHQQVVEVHPDSRVTDVEVSIEFDDGHSRTRQKMRNTGDLDGREHVLVFRNVSHPFRFRAMGGDDITDWVDVDLVEPPAWTSLEMSVQPPAYTRASAETLPPGGGPYAVLAGSGLVIRGSPNKPLSGAMLRGPGGDRELTRTGDDGYEVTVPPEALVSGKYTFDLADESGLRSSRPASFTISVRPDRPPVVRATLLGISGLVVPRAMVPVSWSATDEYPMTGARFAYGWRGEAADSVAQQGTLDLAPAGSNSETAALIGAGSTDIRTVDVLDLETLNVPVGVGFNLTVQVDDNNTLDGPGVGESRQFLLRVVSEEELRADLLRREIEQRQAFETILANQEELQVEVRALAATIAEAGSPLDRRTTESEMLAWQRRQKLVGTNIASIADRFEEFLVEARNNRLDEAENEIDASRTIEVRFNERIIQPIRALDQSHIIEAAQLLDQAQRSIGDAAAFAEGLTRAADKQDEILEAMRAILASMEDSETYQEVVNLAIEVKRRQEQVRELTRQRQQETGTRDIFDDEKPDSPPPGENKGENPPDDGGADDIFDDDGQ